MAVNEFTIGSGLIAIESGRLVTVNSLESVTLTVTANTPGESGEHVMVALPFAEQP